MTADDKMTGKQSIKNKKETTTILKN